MNNIIVYRELLCTSFCCGSIVYSLQVYKVFSSSCGDVLCDSKNIMEGHFHSFESFLSDFKPTGKLYLYLFFFFGINMMRLMCVSSCIG